MSKFTPDVYLAIPCYGNALNAETLSAILQASTSGVKKSIQCLGFSILTRNFNMLYAAALNARKTIGSNVFCMLHADIIPEPEWMDKMLHLMEKHDADILSVVSPIKDRRGVTSTAIDVPLGSSVRRLTVKEVGNHTDSAKKEFNFAPTFTHPALLVNTGLMMVRIDNDWCEKVWFRFEDKVVKNAATRLWEAQGMPEDWLFSRDVRAVKPKARIFATTEINITHVGAAKYTNQGTWGDWEYDRG